MFWNLFFFPAPTPYRCQCPWHWRQLVLAKQHVQLVGECHHNSCCAGSYPSSALQQTPCIVVVTFWHRARLELRVVRCSFLDFRDFTSFLFPFLSVLGFGIVLLFFPAELGFGVVLCLLWSERRHVSCRLCFCWYCPHALLQHNLNKVHENNCTRPEYFFILLYQEMRILGSPESRGNLTPSPNLSSAAPP